MANEHSSSFDGKWGREIRQAEANEKLRADTPVVARESVEVSIEQAAKAVYRKYGANLSAFWRDAFAAEALRHGRADVEQHATDGNCIHCVPICRECRITEVLAHVREKQIIRDEIYATALSVLCDPDLFDDPEIANNLATGIADKANLAATTSPSSETPVGGEAQKCVKCGHDGLQQTESGFCLTYTPEDKDDNTCGCKCEFAPVPGAGDDEGGVVEPIV